MCIYCFQDTGQDKKELDVLMRCLARIQKIDSVVCNNRPVVMFTGTIYACKWFFMKQTLHTVLACNSLQGLHNNLVVVNCHICLCIDRSQLVLCRSYFVVLCLCRNTKFPKLFVHILHERSDPLADGSEVMVIKLLSFRRHCTEECTACKDKVFSLKELLLIYKEVFLLRSYGRSYLLGGSISKQP